MTKRSRTSVVAAALFLALSAQERLQAQTNAAPLTNALKRLGVVHPCSERYFFVGGAVTAPGQKPHLTKMTVTKAIWAGGGFTKKARKNKVKLVRADGQTTLISDVPAIEKGKAKDVEVSIGDVMIVPER